MEFRWNEWNIEHLAEHGVSPEEAELAVSSARRPYPQIHAEDKWLVWGRGQGGRYVQVVFVLDEGDVIYVIHARPLTDREKRRFRKRS